MKIFTYPLIFSALSMHTLAFFGVWTAPGLEIVPTLESVQEEEKPAIKTLKAGETWTVEGVEEL